MNNPKPVPLVPSPMATLQANIAIVQFYPGNGSVALSLLDQRNAPVDKLGDVPALANYELGRFALPPRALRMLLDTANAAAAAYKDATGSDLPTLDQFNARAHIPGLLDSLLSAPKPDDDTK